MNKYLFDASSIVNLVKRGITKVFEHGLTIDLAYYESLNAVWKEYSILKKIDRETALKYVEVLSTVFQAIETTSILGYEPEVFELALRENLTVYDASYLHIAIREKLILVTDDSKLKQHVVNYVKALSTAEFLEEENIV